MRHEPSSGVPTRVLLCDDTRDIILLLGAEFDMHSDLEVVADAATGREAINLAANLQPDVVVLDLSMPEMDGLQALPELLRVAPNTKVVVLSGQEARALGPKVIALGARRYVEKGTPACDIAGIVKEVAQAS
ncbi:MAG: response regulator transcription factor [Actinomycetota bacterium]|nr:response regulator transcription factor [Actinomycetota bacterium]